MTALLRTSPAGARFKVLETGQTGRTPGVLRGHAPVRVTYTNSEYSVGPGAWYWGDVAVALGLCGGGIGLASQNGALGGALAGAGLLYGLLTWGAWSLASTTKTVSSQEGRSVETLDLAVALSRHGYEAKKVRVTLGPDRPIHTVRLLLKTITRPPIRKVATRACEIHIETHPPHALVYISDETRTPTRRVGRAPVSIPCRVRRTAIITKKYDTWGHILDTKVKFAYELVGLPKELWLVVGLREAYKGILLLADPRLLWYKGHMNRVLFTGRNLNEEEQRRRELERLKIAERKARIAYYEKRAKEAEARAALSEKEKQDIESRIREREERKRQRREQRRACEELCDDIPRQCAARSLRDILQGRYGEGFLSGVTCATFEPSRCLNECKIRFPIGE